VARMLLSDMQAGKLLFAQPPPSMPHGSAAFANFVAATHRARFADLRRRKGTGPKSALDGDVVAGGGPSSTSIAAGGGGGASAGASSTAEATAAAEALAARLESIELSSMGDFEEGEAWMDDDLGAELNGNTSSRHTRLRASKDAKVQKKHGGGNFKQKIKGKRMHAAQMRMGESDQGGGAHVAGHTAKAVANTRVVLPHHTSNQPTSSRPTRSAIST